jgi:hypothetical protein
MGLASFQSERRLSLDTVRSLRTPGNGGFSIREQFVVAV